MVTLEYPFLCPDGRVVNKLVNRSCPIPDIYILLLSILTKNFKVFNKTSVNLIIKFFDYNGNIPLQVKIYRLEVYKYDGVWTFKVAVISQNTFFDEYIKKYFHFECSICLITYQITVHYVPHIYIMNDPHRAEYFL